MSNDIKYSYDQIPVEYELVRIDITYLHIYVISYCCHELIATTITLTSEYKEKTQMELFNIVIISKHYNFPVLSESLFFVQVQT